MEWHEEGITQRTLQNGDEIVVAPKRKRKRSLCNKNNAPTGSQASWRGSEEWEERGRPPFCTSGAGMCSTLRGKTIATLIANGQKQINNENAKSKITRSKGSKGSTGCKWG